MGVKEETSDQLDKWIEKSTCLGAEKRDSWLLETIGEKCFSQTIKKKL